MYEVVEGRSEDPSTAVHVVQLFHGGVSWEPLVRGRWPWRAAMATAAVGRRVVVMWEAEYKPGKDRQLQRQLGAKSIPYEAFIVRYDGKEAKLYYTIEDEYRMMSLDDNNGADWQYADAGLTHLSGLPVLTWGYDGEPNVAAESNPDEKKQKDKVAADKVVEVADNVDTPATPPKKRKKVARRS